MSINFESVRRYGASLGVGAYAVGMAVGAGAYSGEGGVLDAAVPRFLPYPRLIYPPPIFPPPPNKSQNTRLWIEGEGGGVRWAGEI